MLRRFADKCFGAPIIVTNSTFRFIAAEQTEALCIKGEIGLEPEWRDAAIAVAVGAVMAFEHAADAVCIVTREIARCLLALPVALEHCSHQRLNA